GSALGATRVQVVIDTIEDMLIHQKDGFVGMLQLLAEARARCPGFRLILSGRYNLAERLGEQIKPYQERGEIRTAEVCGFTHDETLDYLRDLRKVPSEAVRE